MFAAILEIGSRGRIRTYDQVINSHLRYRCATRDRLVRGAADIYLTMTQQAGNQRWLRNGEEHADTWQL
jgi:hypothetical protein